jgi:peptidoglycan/LPS O-acetylase OafA/YrhL
LQRLLLFGTSGIYGELAGSDGRLFAVAPRLAGTVLVGNALFLQGILTPTFGSNGPLWSLSYEFWYYVLFPLIVLAFPAEKVGWATVLYVAAAFMVVFFIGQSISFYFLSWLLGAAINLAPERSGRHGKGWMEMAVGAAALGVAILKFNPHPTENSDFIVGIASTALIFALARTRAGSTSGLYSRTVRRLAGFSYTLYLVHLPALVFVRAWLLPRERWQPDAARLAIAGFLGMSALIYAFVIAWLTEYRTDAARTLVIAAFRSH